jgi:hypothetical protein
VDFKPELKTRAECFLERAFAARICDPRNGVQPINIAAQQSRATHVRFGSEADMTRRTCHVCFTPRKQTLLNANADWLNRIIGSGLGDRHPDDGPIYNIFEVL